MGEESHHNHLQNLNHVDHSHSHSHRVTAATTTAASRLGLGIRSSDIVETTRGHILRSTGRKDRHSKVCTAKGPRDRRVRLAAHTAIQFYDVQDRLGYDRPSKAVDWLIKKAKAAIDELDELPPWNPNSFVCSAAPTSSAAVTAATAGEDAQNNNNNNASLHHHRFSMVEAPSSSNNNRLGGSGVAELVQHNQNNNSSNFLPPSMDSDSIADTIKSFFPMGTATAATETPPYQNYPPDLLSRTSSQSQDLRLSLHSYQDPILLHHHHHQHQSHQNEQASAFLAGTQNPMGFDSSGWAEQQHHHHQQAELNKFQRMVAWNNAGADSNSGGGFTFNSLPLSQTQSPTLPPFLFGGQNQFFSSQRGPLQSSTTPSVHAWIDPSSISDHQHHQITTQSIHNHSHHHSSISGMGFASSGGFSGFHIPARIQGEEEHDGISDKPSSASSNSRH